MSMGGLSRYWEWYNRFLPPGKTAQAYKVIMYKPAGIRPLAENNP